MAIEKSERLYKQNHIATPIQPYETSDSENSECDKTEDEDIIQVSDEEDTQTQPVEEESYFESENESDTISSTEQWVRIIQNWMGMVEEENIDYSDSNEADYLDFIAVDRTIHPAND